MGIENIPDKDSSPFNPELPDGTMPRDKNTDDAETPDSMRLTLETIAEIPQATTWELRKQQTVIWMKRTRYLIPVVATFGVIRTVRFAKDLRDRHLENREP